MLEQYNKPSRMKFVNLIIFLGILVAQDHPESFNYIPTNLSGVFQGQITINGNHASGNDWAAAFDEDGNIAGAGEIMINAGTAYINMPIYGDDTTTPGGKAIPFFSSVRVKLYSGGKFKVGKDVIGVGIKPKIIKNRLGPPHRDAELKMYFTKGLIDDETGYVKTDLPDGTRGFVLGPLVDNYVYLHGYDAYCNIGYMQKDTRQFVLLGKINGKWTEDVHPIPSNYVSYGWGDSPIWDGSESGFTSYNPSFTHAHALWFKEQIDSRKYGANVAYFYSGGVPAQNNPGEYSNLPQWLQDLLEGMKGGLLAGLGKLMDGNSAVAGAGANPNDPLQGFGQGGDPDQITPGKEHTQGDPTTGDSGDANLWGQLWDNIKDKAKRL